MDEKMTNPDTVKKTSRRYAVHLAAELFSSNTPQPANQSVSES